MDVLAIVDVSAPPRAARKVLQGAPMYFAKWAGLVAMVAACAAPAPTGSAESHAVAAVAAPTHPLGLHGIHLAGAEFGSALPGTEGVDYDWPAPADIDYFAGKGMTAFRISFTWERLQKSAYADFEPAYFAKLDALVAHAAARGLTVIIEPHNFAKYYGNMIGSEDVPNAVFGDLWSRLATTYAASPHVVFDLVNEPHDLPTEQWVSAANDAIAAIRSAGAKNVVQVPGNGWTGAYSWKSTDYGTSNAVGMLDIVDPGDNVVFEAHQYLDADSGGEVGTCVSKTIGSERLKPFLDWLRANGKKGFIGELAGGHNPTCDAAIEDMLATIERSSDVLTGWVWWAAGPSWGDYPFSLQPQAGKDAPELKILAPHL